MGLLCIISKALELWIGIGWLFSDRFAMIKECSGHGGVVDVIAYGAVGNGKTDDSHAFLKAWRDICRTNIASPTLKVPSDKIFLLSPITLKGPCTSQDIHLQILGKLIAPNQIELWDEHKGKRGWIILSKVEGLTIHGSGEIDGQGSAWWDLVSTSENSYELERATALRIEECNGLHLSGLKFRNSQKGHISITKCDHATISNISVIAPQDSPNTDGIDIGQSKYVLVKDSSFSTGDDCVAINGGSYFINISNVHCGPGHGISVGSLGANGAHEKVENIFVHNCKFTRSTNGARIKTWQGGSGYARNISFDEITLEQVRNPIIIDQFYCNGKNNCKNQTSAVEVSHVSYSRFHGTCENDQAIHLRCSDTKPCKHITMNHINIRSGNQVEKVFSSCFSAFGRSNDTFPIVSCLPQIPSF